MLSAPKADKSSRRDALVTCCHCFSICFLLYFIVFVLMLRFSPSFPRLSPTPPDASTSDGQQQKHVRNVFRLFFSLFSSFFYHFSFLYSGSPPRFPSVQRRANAHAKDDNDNGKTRLQFKSERARAKDDNDDGKTRLHFKSERARQGRRR